MLHNYAKPSKCGNHVTLFCNHVMLSSKKSSIFAQ
jgi:hypothetical protein